MNPNRVEALGILLVLASAVALTTAGALVLPALGFLAAGLIGLPLGLLLVMLAARAPAPEGEKS